jgi:glycosyltransferase involved in cell wall biosynthesis
VTINIGMPISPSTPIKVVLLIPTLDRSGAEKQLTLLATGLPRDRFDVHVVALTRGGPYAAVLHEHGIPLTVLHKRLKFDPLALWKLRQLLRRLQPDILHTWLFAANSYGRMLAGKADRPRVIVSERCVDTWKSGWQHWIDRRQFARTSRLVGNSHSVAEFYRRQGFPAERLRVVFNGIEVADSAPPDRESLPAEFDIPAGAKIVGYVGRLARQKRVADLVWAMELLSSLDEQAYLLIVGTGPEHERLVDFARKVGIDRRIRFAGHREDASRILQLMDVFWLASDFEGLSNSLMEAMAAGLPVVAADIPPNRELVVEGETGYLVPVGDSLGFAQATQRLLADRELRAELGQAGRDRMQTEFSVQKMVDAYAVLYEEVLACAKSRLVDGLS